MADDLRTRSRRELSARIERGTRLPMLILSIIFLVAIALPELVDVTPEAENGLELLGWLIWALFAFELGVMTYLAESRRRYLLTHWADVLTVALPFLRPLRLLRVAILGVRVWAEAKELIRQRTFSVVAITALACMWAAATLVFMAERGGDGPIQTYGDALWWAAATVTTVGYGDVFPKTPAGRGVAFLLMLVGISVFGLLTARVAAFFVESESDERGRAEATRDGVEARLDEILARLERIERDRPAGPPPGRTSEGAGPSSGATEGTSGPRTP